MNNFNARNLRSLTLAAGLVFTAGCKEQTPPARPPETAAKLPMPPSRPADDSKGPSPAVERPTHEEAVRETMRGLDAKFDAEDKLAEINRRTMVTPAPADFKPEPADRKVRLRLI